jgi:hypothetical protein
MIAVAILTRRLLDDLTSPRPASFYADATGSQASPMRRWPPSSGLVSTRCPPAAPDRSAAKHELHTVIDESAPLHVAARRLDVSVRARVPAVATRARDCGKLRVFRVGHERWCHSIRIGAGPV